MNLLQMGGGESGGRDGGGSHSSEEKAAHSLFHLQSYLRAL